MSQRDKKKKMKARKYSRYLAGAAPEWQPSKQLHSKPSRMTMNNDEEEVGLATTPEAITPEILDFCREICPDAEPAYIKVAEHTYSPGACKKNVDRHIARRGGAAIEGWSIWMIPNHWLSAEYHVIWQSPTKQLLDVSPPILEEQRILFLPSKTTHNWRYIVPAERYRKLSDSPYARYNELRVQADRQLQRETWVDGEGVPPVYPMLLKMACSHIQTQVEAECAARRTPCVSDH